MSSIFVFGIFTSCCFSHYFHVLHFQSTQTIVNTKLEVMFTMRYIQYISDTKIAMNSKYTTK